MNIGAFSVGGMDTASSRLRSFYLFKLAEEFGLNVIRPHQYREALRCDVVHIQKILSYRTLIWIVIFRICGIKVIYDIDDHPIGKKMFCGYWTSLLLSTTITVDSEARRCYWKKYLFFKKIEVVNDVADSIEYDLAIKARRSAGNSDTFFWTGYSHNLGSMNVFLEYLRNGKKFRLVVSTEEKAIPYLKTKYPFVKFIPWFDGVAFDDSIEAKYMILNHDFDQSSLLKSDNKMVLAILAGFVPIVSRTPSYENLAKMLNAEYLLFENVQDVIKIRADLSDFDFSTFTNRANEIVNANYSKRSVLQKFCSTVLR